jgi:hypothetical protein
MEIAFRLISGFDNSEPGGEALVALTRALVADSSTASLTEGLYRDVKSGQGARTTRCRQAEKEQAPPDIGHSCFSMTAHGTVARCRVIQLDASHTGAIQNAPVFFMAWADYAFRLEG